MVRKYVLAGLAVTLVASCDLSSFGDQAMTTRDTASQEFYAGDGALVKARTQFKAGNYGRAYRSFEKVLKVSPNDPSALLGLAASADMLRRFDKADAAYRQLGGLIGNRAEFHNNYGYSLLLRGNLIAARKHFLLAYEQDPSNKTTANNLGLLRNSVHYPDRTVRGI